jgi:hypothetical protein
MNTATPGHQTLTLQRIHLQGGDGLPCITADVMGESGEVYCVGCHAADALTRPEKYLRELSRRITILRRRKPRPKYHVKSLMPTARESNRVY